VSFYFSPQRVLFSDHVNYGHLGQILTYMVCTFFFPLEDKLEKQEKPVNGEDKGDSGVDTQNSEGNADEEDPLGPNCYYDKTKSFFDNISCDDNRYSLLSCSYAIRRLKCEVIPDKFTKCHEYLKVPKDFPDGPVVKDPCFPVGTDLIPGWRTKIPLAVWCNPPKKSNDYNFLMF